MQFISVWSYLFLGYLEAICRDRFFSFYKFQVELLLFIAIGFSQKPDLIHLALEVFVRKQNKNESEGV